MITVQDHDMQCGDEYSDVSKMSVIWCDSDVHQTIDQHFPDSVASRAHSVASAYDRDGVTLIVHVFN
jgi:hypothetical protein